MKPITKEDRDDIWDEYDRRFIKTLNDIIGETKRLDKLKDESFDRMEADADYFRRMKIIHEINNSKSPKEIERLWQEFKVIEKRTRV